MDEFTKKDCIRTMYDEIKDGSLDNSGKVCIIPYDKLDPKFRTPENQLFRVSCGFGITPSGGGNACYGHFCNDGEKTRWEKFKFIGVGNEQVEKYAEQLESEWQSLAIKKCDEREM